MSANYSFAGEINRNNAMGAVADTMNELNLDILKATMEMGGKQVVLKDGNAYALERLDTAEVKNLTDKAGDAITDAGVAETVFNILGIQPDSDILGGVGLTTDGAQNWTINLTANDDKSVTFNVAYIDKNTGNIMQMGAKIDTNGKCIGFSELKESKAGSLGGVIFAEEDIVEVNSGGLLESWGISDPEELQPGDLFLVQQKLQIIKDTVSAVHTTGKTQGDIMREATQKFAQG